VARRLEREWEEKLAAQQRLGEEYERFLRIQPRVLTVAERDAIRQLAADLPTANLPDYSFLVPNLCDDAHNCSLSTADNWLKAKIDPIVQSPVFQKDGLLIIVFDEGDKLDFTSGGGHIAAVVVSPLSKPGYKSIAFYQHQSVLRLMLEGLGVTKLPGDAASAPAMWEFFNGQ